MKERWLELQRVEGSYTSISEALVVLSCIRRRRRNIHYIRNWSNGRPFERQKSCSTENARWLVLPGLRLTEQIVIPCLESLEDQTSTQVPDLPVSG